MFERLVRVSKDSNCQIHHLLQNGGKGYFAQTGITRDEKPLRGAIYARFSTGMQNEESIERQVAQCLEWCSRHNVIVAKEHVYADRAHSGKYILHRENLLRMMADVKTGIFDIVIIEDHSRLSRDLGHSGHLFNRLKFDDTLLASAQRGVLDASDIAIFGYFSAEQREQVSRQVRDHKRVLWAKGSWQSRIPYGYQAVAGSPGYITKNLEQVRVIERAFDLVDVNVTPSDIARTFNAEGIPCPFAHGEWRREHISRVSTRVGGLVRNPLYIGRMIQGTVEIQKDPVTEIRRTRFRPQQEGVEFIEEDLRIVTDEQYWRVAARLDEHKETATKSPDGQKKRAPTTTFVSSLVFCCDAAHQESGPRKMVIVGQLGKDYRHLGCPSTSCLSRSLPIPEIQKVILETVRDKILLPSMNDEFVAKCQDEKSLYVSNISRSRANQFHLIEGLLNEKAKAERNFSSVSTERQRGIIESALVSINQEIREAEMKLRSMPTPLVFNRSNNMDALRSSVDELIARGDFCPTTGEEILLHGALKEIVSRVDVTMNERDYGFKAKIHLSDSLSGLIGVSVIDAELASDGEHEIAGRFLRRGNDILNFDAYRLSEKERDALLMLKNDHHNAWPKFKSNETFLDTVEAIYMRLLTDAPWSRLPGNARDRLPSVRIESLKRVGFWRDVLRCIEMSNPDVFGRMNVAAVRYLMKNEDGRAS